MKLHTALEQYIRLKSSLGFRFRAESVILRAFRRAMKCVDLGQVQSTRVRAYLDGRGPLTRFWERKWVTLRGFYRFAQARGWVRQCPLPRAVPKLLRAFLQYLTQQRGCAPSTLNQRLAALRAWARFVGGHSPEQTAWSGQVRALAFRKAAPPLMAYLERTEMQALLQAPDRRQPQGRRDAVLLLFLYNTGARASEAIHLSIGDIDFAVSAVTLLGKGNKHRRCPLWPTTRAELKALAGTRGPTERVFLNRQGRPLTRFGVHTLVERHTRTASRRVPSLQGKRVSPHTLRHTTAMHLLRAGVDINTIRAWLGHASLQTTHMYAECDLEMKSRALAMCEASLLRAPSRRSAHGLMGFLKAV